jgi:hypothetical protein
MGKWSIYINRAAIICWATSLAVAAAPTGASAAGKDVPPFSEVQQTVWRCFQSRPDFQPNDLITCEDVAPLLSQLQQKGFPLRDAKQILEKVPAKGEFLVSQLSTPNGRKFMRRITVYPDGYDRLDRLSRLPLGQQTVRDLIRGPGGDKLIEYMTTSSGGRELGKQLSNVPNGEKFNAATGRIYTVPMLLDRLQQSYAAELKAAGRNTIAP